NEHGLVPITIKHVTASEFPNSSSERHPDDNAAHVGAFDALLEAPLQNGVPLFVRRREARTITCLTGGS
ncbi:MAG TPA: hypothetical protein VFR37_24090, partial [Longimicrobium sp.]|nr:hypothetical protein [Longimicrobium sp.]